MGQDMNFISYVKYIFIIICVLLIVASGIYINNLSNERDKYLIELTQTNELLKTYKEKTDELAKLNEDNNATIEQLQKDAEIVKSNLDKANDEVLKLQADNSAIISDLVGTAPKDNECQDNFKWMIDSMIQLGNGFNK